MESKDVKGKIVDKEEEDNETKRRRLEVLNWVDTETQRQTTTKSDKKAMSDKKVKSDKQATSDKHANAGTDDANEDDTMTTTTEVGALEAGGLRRQTNMVVPVDPGAYAITPGGGARNQSSPDEDSLVPPEQEQAIGSGERTPRHTVPFGAEVVDEKGFEDVLQERMEARTVTALTVSVSGKSSDGSRNRDTPSRVWILVVAGLFFLGIALGATLPSKNNKTAAVAAPATPTGPPTTALLTLSPTSPPTLAKMELALNLLIPLSGEATLKDPSSPQYQALQWLVEEDELADAALASLQQNAVVSNSSELSLSSSLLTERFVLALLYFATGGPDWTLDFNFLNTTASVCDWQNKFGLGCNEEGVLKIIRLNQNNLNGTIPSELSTLTSLRGISIFANTIFGTIPSSLGNLTNLEFLQVGANQISGSIPDSFSNLQKLEVFWGSYAYLTGTIPPGFFQIPSLEFLALAFNLLTGPIPEGLPEDSNELTRIDFNMNLLTGTIPDSMFVPDMEQILLWHNLLSGTISPTNIQNLDTIYWMLLDSNQLTGTVPTELATLSDLERLFLSENMLSGTIPSELGRLTRLEVLSLNTNQFTGTVPIELAALSANTIHLFYNNLTGSMGEFCDAVDVFARVEADCGGADPQVDCPCCSTCCDASLECEIELMNVCELEKQLYVHETGEFYYPDGGTMCECSTIGAGEANTTLLSCADTQCQSCTEDGSICSINQEFVYGYDELGAQNSYLATFQYVKGRNETVTLRGFISDDNQESCEVAIDGVVCDSCLYAQCASAPYMAVAVGCANVEGGAAQDHVCNTINDYRGPLTLFYLQDPFINRGCLPRIAPQVARLDW